MDISELADAFYKIETTVGRERMTLLLSDLFRGSPDNAAILPYLLQGRLGPPYATPDIGMDERRIALALARATGHDEPKVWNLYKHLGDLGLVAEQLLPSRGQAFSVQDTYQVFLRIARTTGEGASETKIAIFEDVLRCLGGREARYVVRMALGRLRLGVGDATIMDALSVACSGDTSLRPRIEHAYTFCSDLGLVARILVSSGPAALDRIRPEPGRPVLSALADRLPSAAVIIQKLGTVIAEPKYDGLRLQVHKRGDQIWLFTRRLEDVTHAFPEISQAACRQIAAHQAIVDGEAVGYDPTTGQLLPFQQTVRRRRKHAVPEMASLYPLRYYAFDLLDQDGQDLTPLALRERSRRLREVVRAESHGPIYVTPQIETSDARELDRFFDEMVRKGLEGVLAKRPESPYHAGARRANWVKLKHGYQQALADTFDVVVVGYNRGRGRRARLEIGSLLTAVYDPEHDRYRTVSWVGSGLTDAEWIYFREMLDAIRVPEKPKEVDSSIAPDVWVEPRYVIEVIAGEITRSPRHTCGKVGKQPGFALRFPRMARFRFDRRPEDATTEAEILAFYRQRTEDGTHPHAVGAPPDILPS